MRSNASVHHFKLVTHLSPLGVPQVRFVPPAQLAQNTDSKLSIHIASHVTVPAVTLSRKVGPGLQDLQTRARRILAEKNAKKAEENTWIGRMVAAKNINDMKALIKSHDSA